MTYEAGAKQRTVYTEDNLGQAAKDFLGVTEHNVDTARLWVLLELVYMGGHGDGLAARPARKHTARWRW